jgi:hypothetical protein
MKSFFDRWLDEFCLVILALVCAAVARAQTPCAKVADNRAHVCWEAPIVNTDGTPIVLALTYDVEQQTGTTWTRVATGLTSLDWTSGVLTPGTYTYRVIANAGGRSSDPSGTANKTATNPQPLPPSIQVVQVVIGVDHAPVFTVLSDGSRSTTVGGFASVGTPCEGDVLFRYRNRDYRKPVAWKPWSTSSSARVAAPCS